MNYTATSSKLNEVIRYPLKKKLFLDLVIIIILIASAFTYSFNSTSDMKIGEPSNNDATADVQDQNLAEFTQNPVNDANDPITKDVADKEHHNSYNKDGQASTEPKFLFEQPSYEIVSTGLIEITIENVKELHRGTIEIWSANENMEFSELTMQLMEIPQEKIYAEVPSGLYRVDVGFDTTQSSEPLYVQVGQETQLSFAFNEIVADFYDFDNASPQQLVTVVDSDGNIVFEPSYVDEHSVLQLIVEPGKYEILGDFDGSIKVDATQDVIVPVNLSLEETTTSSLELDEEASFGVLVVNSSTVNDMPLQGVTTRWYNASNYADTGSGSSNATGMVSFSLAPDTYDLSTYFQFTPMAMWNHSVVVTGGALTLVQVGLSHLQVYTVGSEYTTLYNATDGSTIGSVWSGSDSVHDFFVPGSQNYTVAISGGPTYSNNVIGFKERISLGTKVLHAPTWVSVSTDGRINANQSTLVYLRAKDINYDYPLQFYVSPNVGSISISDPHWVADETWGIEINYTAPITDEFYQLNVGVEDIDGLFTNQTLYLSNRESGVTLRQTGDGFRSLNQYTLMDSVNGPDYSGWTGSDGNYSANVLDGYYRISWYGANTFTGDYVKIDASVGTYFFQYNWTELLFNTTAEWDNPIGVTMRVYNATASLSTIFATGSTSSSTGLGSLVISPYQNYSIVAEGTNRRWQHLLSFQEATLYKLNFTFGGLAVYTYDSNDNPDSQYVQVYNGTDDTLITSVWSGSDGIALFRLIDYTNYSVYVSTETTWIYNITVEDRKAVAVGDFTNSAPTISLIDTNPTNTKINAGENVTIEVSASDIDPIDQLSYTWSANVGSFLGSGSSLLYIAPAWDQDYKVTVLVEDQFGGNASTYIYVSNRYSTVNIYTNRSTGAFNQYVTVQRIRDGYTTASGWSGSDGTLSWSIVDGEYEVAASQYGKGFNIPLFANASTYNINLVFADFQFNTTGGGSIGFGATVRIRDNSTNSIHGTVTTGSDGLSTLTAVSPGNYTLQAISSNSIWKYNVTVTAGELVPIEFKFAEILTHLSTGYDNPQNFYTTLSDSSGDVLSVWSGSDGLHSFYAAPGNYSVRSQQDNTYQIDNILVSENQLYDAYLSFATLVVYSNDGSNPISQTVYVYNATTNALIRSLSTGSDGMVIFTLRPGLYDVNIGGSDLHTDILLNPSDRVGVGTQLNTAPVITLISSSPSRVGANEQTTVSVEVSDIDYDYPNMVISVTPNVGSISDLMAFHGFAASNTFVMTFVFNSPSTLDLYYVNISVSDGFDSVEQRYFLSNSYNTLHLHSERGGNLPQSTGITIYDYQTGSQEWSGSTATTGYVQADILDGWYNIRFAEHNYIWFNDIFISNNAILNLTASFGEVTVFASGLGGNPINAYTIVTNSTDSSTVSSGWTGSDGEITYILAPGDYTIEVQQSTSIFFNVLIEGGKEAVVGSEIPQLASPPDDISYEFGDTGNTVTWEYSDGNPSYYNVSIDGVFLEEALWDGSPITVNVDGLGVGTHIVHIFVNDTYGYYNFDEVEVTVLIPTEAPSLTQPVDQTIHVEDPLILNWTLYGSYGGDYEVYKDGVVIETGTWVNETLVAIDVGLLLPGEYNYTIFMNNTEGITASDSVFVTVSSSLPPVIEGPLDYTIEASGNITISWEVTGEFPSNYEIYRNGSLIDSGTWTLGNNISLFEATMLTGVYNYTLVVCDVYAGCVSDTVNVIVTTPLTQISIIDTPNDGVYSQGSQVNALVWNLTGDYSGTYEISINGSVVSTGVIPSYTISFTPNMADLAEIGTYPIMLTIIQSDGVEIVDIVYITIVQSSETESDSDDSPGFELLLSLLTLLALISVKRKQITSKRRQL